MSTKDKELARLASLPADYRWEEIEALLKALGYAKDTNDGSRVKFFRVADQSIIVLHRPHPGNIMKRYMLKQILQKLREGGELNGQHH